MAVNTLEQVDPMTAKENVLTVAEIESARDAEYVMVEVPEWGGNLRLASVTTDMVEAMAKVSQNGDPIGGMMELLVQSFVNEQGQRSVTDPVRIKQIAVALRKKEAKVIERLLTAMMKLNNIKFTKPSEIGV